MKINFRNLLMLQKITYEKLFFSFKVMQEKSIRMQFFNKKKRKESYKKLIKLKENVNSKKVN